jgi:hypothetical protein
MTRQVTITLPFDVAHTLEILSAKDEMRLADGIAALLISLTEGYQLRRGVK